jgi:hypothetical protein
VAATEPLQSLRPNAWHAIVRGSDFHNTDTQTHIQQGDFINFLSFFQNNENRLIVILLQFLLPLLLLQIMIILIKAATLIMTFSTGVDFEVCG